MTALPESDVDVLIIGAGPAGLMLALWLARLGVKTRIVDKRTSKVYSGQADGFQVRSLEILDSFGITERVWKEANHMLEVSFWNPDEGGTIRRSARAANTIPGLSRFTESVLHQGRIEQFFLDAIRDSYASDSDALHVERMVIPTSLEIDEAKAEDPDAHPVTVTLRHLTEEEATPTQMLSNLSDGIFRSNLADDDVGDILDRSEGREARDEVVRAKYVVGCDGAHSWTRKTLGKDFEMKGETTDAIWGVMDIVPITDFPDIRSRTVIHSTSGALMIIPRENRRSLARKKLEYHYCDWWTAYQIGQRTGDHFSKLDRVFLAGDAVHTHSPKAGQGMNVSMQDSYNLGWKIGLACKGILPRHVLSTYELERKKIAKDLIAFDGKFSKLFTGRPAKDIQSETGVSDDEFQKAFHTSRMFTTGVGVNYQPTVLVAREPEETDDDDDHGLEKSAAKSTPSLATNCEVGRRFPSFKVVRQADGRLWELHHKLPSDGRFRLVVFGGDISQASQRDSVNAMGAWLSSYLPGLPTITLSPGSDPHGGSVKFKTERDPSVVDVLLVHSAPRDEVEVLRDVHEAYHPFDSKLGWDYDKVFVDGETYYEEPQMAYEKYGVHRARGAVVGLRPDGYVGLVTSLDHGGQDEVRKWFDGIFQRT
ncbi:Putative FAD-binding domain, phenol hydroxylase dimerization domain, Thioredoxin-like superfamily [Colletotrichum destructivum]|uniref:FAD-binding domain, phenol hydroxylase dimerization domain, Thioredoxin-like superfamily n=1 Tax=Colletotrichum destructivum TaxID=34406 RepID=A0AAX4I657_9PEZI|nr:Putative FAD-binding domain, phenol hydroxylase dimerization domain, Thioredoxin-like superfamily [Colletotrichum destructivum]